MTLSRLARMFGKAAVIVRDVNAVKRGRVGRRVYNRAVGRTFGKLLRKVIL